MQLNALTPEMRAMLMEIHERSGNDNMHQIITVAQLLLSKEFDMVETLTGLTTRELRSLPLGNISYGEKQVRSF